MTVNKVSIDIQGKEYSIETGKLAKFANGSVVVRCGDTMVMVVVVAAEKEREGIDFLPLQVEYREKMSAAGKFPGGFLKRESRPSDKEILTSRLIDRPCRPLFPKYWQYETQVIAQVISAEPGFDPENLAAVGASAAIMISDIPFAGPISSVRVGRINGEFIANPSMEQLKDCDLDISIAGTDASIVMVEGESNEISEKDFVEALVYGHEVIKQLNALQNELLKLTSKPKREVVDKSLPEEFLTVVNDAISEDLKKYVYAVTTKNERNATRAKLSEIALEKAKDAFGENEAYEGKIEAYASKAFSKLEKQAMRAMILKDKVRLDGRTPTQIRPITCEVGLLPRVHGSALFTRGETQSLTTSTLGTKSDEQMIDGLLPVYTNKFYLHYNFPPYSVGEVGRYGPPGRREVGHGNLAERALRKVLPSEESFPYTIRTVSDILESNGSSSMATVCAGSLSLFDAGVPMKKAVSGIAMGLIMEENEYTVLSDILGDEDFLGDMDFKVAGTVDGITACQMDIKIEGLSIDLLTNALEQARVGRLHILDIMNDTLSEPRTDLSQYAPRFTTMKIDTNFIGAVIGSGGETIRSITKETNTEINIEDDGTIIIAATSGIDAERARTIIEGIIRVPSEGEVFMCTVKEIKEGIGAVVEFLPSKQGLLHISQIQYERTNNVEDVLQVGQELELKMIEVTRDGKYRLSRKAMMPAPEGYVEPERKPFNRDSRDRDNRGGGRDRRDDDRRRPSGGDRNRR